VMHVDGMGATTELEAEGKSCADFDLRVLLIVPGP